MPANAVFRGRHWLVNIPFLFYKEFYEWVFNSLYL
jgi:hypothetical protein